MKKIIIITSVTLFITINCFSQTSEKVDYRQKSKNQKTAAWVLLGGGALIDIVGAIVYPKHLGLLDNTASDLSKEKTAYILFITGTASMLGSIPFFASSAKNKRRSMTVSFKNESASQLQRGIVLNKPLASLSFTIRL